MVADKQRLDVILVERGLAPSRAKAQSLIRGGHVFSGEQRLDRPGQPCAADLPLTVRDGLRYVSRGGAKLEGALAAFRLDVRDRVCVDIGAATGGFTDCLLQHGARCVYAVDVGENQLADALRRDSRVVVMDRTNARHLTAESFPQPIDLAVVDASFIGIEKLLPAISRVLTAGARVLALVKPQFQAGPAVAARSNGVIRDEVLRSELIAAARDAFAACGFEVEAGVDSSVLGPQGNREHFVLAVLRGAQKTS